jgi:hypothetical protein
MRAEADRLEAEADLLEADAYRVDKKKNAGCAEMFFFESRGLFRGNGCGRCRIFSVHRVEVGAVFQASRKKGGH